MIPRFLAGGMAAALIVLAPVAALAGRQDRLKDYPLYLVLDDPAFQARLPAGVSYYFADEPVTVKQIIGPTSTNRRTAASNRGDMANCRWAMLSGLIALGEDAKARGGNAVIGIKSNFKGDLVASQDSFRCGVGKMMVGVTLVGEVAVVVE